MLARRMEFYLGPALHGQVEIDPRRRQIGEVAGAVQGEVGSGLVAEIRKPLGIGAVHPTGDGDVDLSGVDGNKHEKMKQSRFVTVNVTVYNPGRGYL